MDIEIYKKGYKDYLCTLHFARDIILGQCNVREQFTGRPEGPSVPAGPGGPMGPGISFGFTSYPAATSLQPQGILQIVEYFQKIILPCYLYGMVIHQAVRTCGENQSLFKIISF